MIGLIEGEIVCKLTQRAAESEQRETAAASSFEGSFEWAEWATTEEQRESDF